MKTLSKRILVICATLALMANLFVVAVPMVAAEFTYDKAMFDSMTVIDELDDDSKIVSIKNETGKMIAPIYLTDNALFFSDPASYTVENEIVWQIADGGCLAMLAYYYKGQVDQTGDWLPTDINTPKFYVSSDNANWTPVEIVAECLTIDDWANLQYQFGIVHWISGVPDNCYLKMAFTGDNIIAYSSLRQCDDGSGDANVGGDEEVEIAYTYDKAMFDSMSVIDELNDDSKIVSIKNETGKRIDPIYLTDKALHFTDPANYAAENEVVWQITDGGCLAMLGYYYKGQVDQSGDWLPTDINTPKFYVSTDNATWTRLEIVAEKITIDDWANLQYQLGVVHWIDNVPNNCYLKMVFTGDGVTCFSSLRRCKSENGDPVDPGEGDDEEIVIEYTYDKTMFDAMNVIDEVNDDSKIVSIKNETGMRIDPMYLGDNALHFTDPANYAVENEVVWQIADGGCLAMLGYYYRGQVDQSGDWLPTDINTPKFYVSTDNATWTQVEIIAEKITIDDWANMPYQLGVVHWIDNVPNNCYLKMAFTGDGVTAFSSLRQCKSENDEPACEHEYAYPCDPICSKCYELTNPDAAHSVKHVAAQEPTCTAEGNIEYWYCEYCGAAWLDELCHLNTNLRAVVLPMADHSYDNDYDVDCNVCGGIRTVEMPIASAGTSVSEDVSGLAALFEIKVDGLAIKEGTKTVADYSNATVDGYKLIDMGVIASNNVDELTIPAKYLFELDAENGTATYAARIINIPADKYDVEITFRSYFVIEIDGVETTVYGDTVTASYNAVLNG